MGHDHHFLARLDRASRAEVEFALALYRDHEALKFILESARVPPKAERIALEITPGGPHVIVQRDGRFVTCLGSGMSVAPHPVVSRARIDHWLAAVADLRARHKMAAQVERPGEGLDGLFGRVIDRADSLSREEFIGISAWQGLMAPQWYREAMEGTAHALRWAIEPMPRCGRRGVPRDAAYARWKLFWGIGHQWLLATMGSRDYMAAHLADLESRQLTVSAGIAMLGSTRLAMRAWWGAGRIGKPLVAVAKRRLVAANDVRELVDAAMTLAVIGLRHAGLRAETRKALTAPRPYGSDHLKQGAAVIAEELARAFDDPEGYDRSFVDMGRELYLERSAHLPAGSPWRFACAEDVPDDLARAMALGCDKDTYSDDQAGGYALWSAATIAKARAEDFYLPREVERALRTPWTPERTEELLGRHARRRERPEPKRVTTTIGRNDPCACGSGKKHKRCCGGWAGPSALAASA